MAGAVDHRQALVHEQLSHMFDVPLVGPAEHLTLRAPQHSDGLQGSGQHHGGQGGGEDEAGCKGAHRVHQGGAAGDVASHTAKGFTWSSNYYTIYYIKYSVEKGQNSEDSKIDFSHAGGEETCNTIHAQNMLFGHLRVWKIL